ncbi:MAG: YqgE/AlgH family protein [Rickettsiaceae bacterium]|nr:YqgE/AlgH family protein [Rickettsiaceae bacterium]
MFKKIHIILFDTQNILYDKYYTQRVLLDFQKDKYMNISEFNNLTGKILIASPFAMKGMLYHHSLIYVIHHSDNGAIGFVFNHKTHDMPVSAIFKDYEIKTEKKIAVYVGGPIDVKHGFFLHTDDYNQGVLVTDHQNKLCISSNPQILQDIIDNKGPAKITFIIGYTSWGKGQIEEEIKNNLWIVNEPNHELIFDLHHGESWVNALNIAGIKSEFFIPTFNNIKN